MRQPFRPRRRPGRPSSQGPPHTTPPRCSTDSSPGTAPSTAPTSSCTAPAASPTGTSATSWAYVSTKGKKLTGGWSWGCSHNEGIALHPEKTGAFTSLCFDDWRSGLFVSTGIGAPDNAPVVQREQCWAGYCGGTFADRTGDLVKSSTGRYATAFASRGTASAKKNPDDSSGRGWTVTPKTSTHQVAVAFLKNRNSAQARRSASPPPRAPNTSTSASPRMARTVCSCPGSPSTTRR
ncbi:hypothetical protein [Streptomyces cupreus]|uniref:hypothetical protein n=1 Tax=Streptomyces cupreus TaxID=2759956 RepID=UPI0021B2A9E0|nr:hypothetical protein [Streptomyces cupreus]